MIACTQELEVWYKEVITASHNHWTIIWINIVDIYYKCGYDAVIRRRPRSRSRELSRSCWRWRPWRKTTSDLSVDQSWSDLGHWNGVSYLSWLRRQLFPTNSDPGKRTRSAVSRIRNYLENLRLSCTQSRTTTISALYTPTEVKELTPLYAAE